MRPNAHRGIRPYPALALVLLTTFCGCATTHPSMTGPSDQTGVASYYGQEHDGRPTASGERFDMRELTAAHRTLPYGTRVRVVNIENGRSVIVRINDRGPFRKDRVLDLSYAAAEELQMIGPGTARIRLEVLETPSE